MLIHKINMFKTQNRTFRENERNSSINIQNRVILEKLINVNQGKKTVSV